ncbi:MAG: DegT/DnrJ/EryC1/StrS family aminotransferase [Promethearchaeota archaeon]|jgi:dTDP-4-amino-4,6-dideoxygalactose transaminase
MDKPAILGGEPAFKNLLPITKPTLPNFEMLIDSYKEIFNTGMITNSKYVKEFENRLREYINVDHAIAVSSCTSGIMLVLKGLGLKEEVILPSFTFSASGHGLIWNGLRPKFVDIDNETYNLDIESVKEAISPATSGILGVHMFGNPCNISALNDIAEDHHLKLIFDAAHAMGSRYKGDNIGKFGNAEVFSCSPTKLMVTGEGGIVTTNDEELKRKVSIGRNYGDDGSYDCEFTGMNARMSEMHAILGLESLNGLEKNLATRSKMAELYKSELASIPGIKFQKISSSCRTTYKDFSIYLEQEMFGLNRDELCVILSKENIMSKKYFFPPLHKQRAYSEFYEIYKNELPVTDEISNNVLSLPLFSHITKEEVLKVTEKIKQIHDHSKEIHQKLNGGP